MSNCESKSVFSVVVLYCFLLMPGHSPLAANQVEHNGNILRTLVPAVAFGATLYLHDVDGRSQFYKSFLTNYAITRALKKTISKTRPNGKDDDSFPSGHTSTAFQGAAFIHRRYGFKYAATAYLAATYVAWSRVDSDNHFTVDVIAGAAIGVASSFVFTKPYKGFVVTPLAANGIYGIGVSKRW